VALALQAGGAWNTEVPQRDAGHNRNFQYYAQGIVNVALADRVSLGVVPSLLRNYAILSEESETQLSVGLYGRVRATRVTSALVEWNMSESGFNYAHDAFSVGLELETGGHFFKLIATNSTTLSMSQYLPGTNDSGAPRNWRLGFLITRLLKI
jgi:hypothetical protein